MCYHKQKEMKLSHFTWIVFLSQLVGVKTVHDVPHREGQSIDRSSLFIIAIRIPNQGPLILDPMY